LASLFSLVFIDLGNDLLTLGRAAFRSDSLQWVGAAGDTAPHLPRLIVTTLTATMEQTPQLGQLIEDGDRRRDAIHVAVAAARASERLQPGQRVGLVQPDDMELAGPVERPIGIVDPFLIEPVEAGERFWLLLFPNSITGLRHIWTHPAFSAVAAEQRKRVTHAE
jgi:hypothetical protein